MTKRKRKLNYVNIAIFVIIIVLVISIILLICSGKEENIKVSSSDSSSESSSVLSVSSDEVDSSSFDYESSSSSEENSSSSSEITVPVVNTTSGMPEDPYTVDTTGKTVRNAFDENGEIDLLFPINTTYYVTRNFKVQKTEVVEGDYVMDHRAAPHCREMLEAMRNELGSKIAAFSTLRTYSYQEGNFKRKMQKYLDKGYSRDEAYKTAATIVAIPGTSEHQLGLAIDVYLWSLYNRDGELNESFEQTEEYKWLQDNSYKYGFILSFPKDKIADTGIIYEPWHYRYVGIENAKIIKESGLTLAQWLESQNIVYVYNGK